MCDATIAVIVVVAGQYKLLFLLAEALFEGGFMEDNYSKDRGEGATLIDSLLH